MESKQAYILQNIRLTPYPTALFHYKPLQPNISFSQMTLISILRKQHAFLNKCFTQKTNSVWSITYAVVWMRQNRFMKLALVYFLQQTEHWTHVEWKAELQVKRSIHTRFKCQHRFQLFRPWPYYCAKHEIGRAEEGEVRKKPGRGKYEINKSRCRKIGIRKMKKGNRRLRKKETINRTWWKNMEEKHKSKKEE
jgi:hypothetical protein